MSTDRNTPNDTHETSSSASTPPSRSVSGGSAGGGSAGGSGSEKNDRAGGNPPSARQQAVRTTWDVHGGASRLVARLLAGMVERCPGAADAANRIRQETGSRLGDWIDHLEVPYTAVDPDVLRGAGFIHAPLPEHEGCWQHLGGRLPVILRGRTWRAAIKVDDVAACCSAFGAEALIAGTPGPGLRQARLASGDGAELWCVDRLGTAGFATARNENNLVSDLLRWRDRLRLRHRPLAASAQAFSSTRELLHGCITVLGQAAACDLFFAVEREFWQRRSLAGALQKLRQDRLGLGWGNHDHHTFRSSRQWFAELIACLELLGMRCRERFHAGKEAGWGAQVLEHPITSTVVFADVDLSPDEITGDIAHQGLSERNQLGTVGLWCALHGEAFFSAGLHHLACLGDFAALRSGMESFGVSNMEPFTDFPHLHQSFTTGENWKVDRDRVSQLVAAGSLGVADGERITRDGARGSHLELIERNEAFKGFNQQGVSHIITATDPRR